MIQMLKFLSTQAGNNQPPRRNLMITRTISWILLTLTLILVGCSRGEGQLGPDAPPEAVPDILGTYVVNGSDHLGNDYGGHLTITAGEKPGEYQLQWILVESVQTGTGILKGNQLHAQWYSLDPATPPYQGQVVYTITVDGQLYGKRTVEDRTGEGLETAYPNP
jgi:hypothetical protein